MDIVIIPFHDMKKWEQEGYRTRDAHLYQHFIKNKNINKILIVNRPISFAELLVKRKKWNISIAEKIEYSGLNKCLSKINDKTWCLDILLPDFFKVVIQRKAWWYTAFQDKRVLDEINTAQKYIGIENSVVLLQNPMAVGIVNNVEYDVLAFDAIDNWLEHPQMNRYNSIISKNYNLIDNTADIIFTVSKDLKKLFQRNEHVYWIPNGDDKNFFACDERRKQQFTIGYVGKIQDRLDLNLIERCAKEFPKLEFEFAGPVYSQKSEILRIEKQYDNIHFIGNVEYEKLPQLLARYSIAIIPHKIDDFTNSMNPLKLYEYLAAGKPVITMAVAGTSNISPYVFQASNTNEFIANIHKVVEMIEEEELDEQMVRNSLSNEYSWDYLSDEMINLIGIMEDE